MTQPNTTPIEEGFRVETRRDTRTQPVFNDSHKWLRGRPAYKRIVLAEYERPERWEGDVDITSIGRFDYVDGRHVLKPSPPVDSLS